MLFWLFMFISTLLIPMSLLLIWYLCPKFRTINSVSGYRSFRSKKNQDTWIFAQKYCSKVSLYMFFPTILLSIVIMPLFINKSTDKIGWAGLVVTIVQIISFAVIIICTERALKRKFDKNGKKC